jgi:hypothetical protein
MWRKKFTTLDLLQEKLSKLETAYDFDKIGHTWYIQERAKLKEQIQKEEKIKAVANKWLMDNKMQVNYSVGYGIDISEYDRLTRIKNQEVEDKARMEENNKVQVYDPSIIRQMDEEDKLRRLLASRTRVHLQQSMQLSIHILSTASCFGSLSLALIAAAFGTFQHAPSLFVGVGVFSVLSLLFGIIAIVTSNLMTK